MNTPNMMHAVDADARAIIRPTGAAGGSLGARTASALWLLVTPAFQLAINHNLFITGSHFGFIDPWVYTGFFLSFPRFLHDYAGTYYVTRLPWILPGFVAHALLPPLAANYVLHLGLFYLLLLGLYRFISHGAGRALALLVVLLSAWEPMMLSSVSWDYVDGAGLVYLVWTFAFVESSITSKRSGIWLIAAGASVAMAAGTNLSLLAFWPIAVLFYLVRCRRPLTMASLARAGAAFVAGAFAAIGVLCAANRSLGGDWLFFMPSLVFGSNLLSGPNPWAQHGLLRFTVDHYLALPVAATLGALWACLSARRHQNDFEDPASWRFAMATQAAVLAAFAIWAFFELRGTPVLSLTYYAVYLFPLSLSAIALQSKIVGLRFDGSSAVKILVWTQGVLLVVHWLMLTPRRFMVLPAFEIHSLRIYTACVMTCGAAAVVALRGTARPILRWVTFSLCMGVVYSTPNSTYPASDVAGGRSRFESIVTAHRFIGSQSPGNDLRFWYSGSSPGAGLRIAIASTYLWGYRLLSDDWPHLKDSEAAGLSGKRLVALLEHANDVDTTVRALKSRGFSTDHTVVREFGAEESRVYVLMTNPVHEKVP